MEADEPVTEKRKILVPILGGVLVVAVGIAVTAIILQIQERRQRFTAERELVVALTEKDNLKTQLRSLRKAKADLEKGLARVETELATVQEDMKASMTAREALSKSVQDRQKEIDRLSRDLEQIRSERTQLGMDLGEIRSTRSELEDEIADLRRAKRELENKVMELAGRPTVELDKIVVNEGRFHRGGLRRGVGAPVSLAPVGFAEGQVIVVNREYDFVVLNLGKNHGLSIGQEFQIVQDTQVVATVKVEKIYDELSAAAILPQSDKALIREGDGVRAL